MSCLCEEAGSHERPWRFSAADEALAGEIQVRLPPAVFDIHAHLDRKIDKGKPSQPSPFLEDFLNKGEEVTDLRAWRDGVGRQVGTGRLKGGLFMGWPYAGMRIASLNRFVVDQVAAVPYTFAALLISPDPVPPADVVALWEHPKVRALKPYHCFSSCSPTWASRPGDFLPEWAWEIAHQRKLMIVLHLTRQEALADPVNRDELLSHCLRYPEARLMLAHAGHCYHSPNASRGIGAFTEIENVYFDTSTVCEAETLAYVIRAAGSRRVLWGSDFVFSQARGRMVTIGTTFAFVSEELFRQSPEASLGYGGPAMVGLESLRALLAAADILGLGYRELQDIFCGNALRMLGEAGTEGSME